MVLHLSLRTWDSASDKKKTLVRVVFSGHVVLDEWVWLAGRRTSDAALQVAATQYIMRRGASLHDDMEWLELAREGYLSPRRRLAIWNHRFFEFSRSGCAVKRLAAHTMF